ncbi:MAG: isoprenyl transferase [Proteobacteria bacterium]|nr:isoprenyl transferase [Pseudomonadota bacterium]
MSAPSSKAELAPKAELAQKADFAKTADLPRHVAIIMDGNGRWARARHMPRAAGHVAGVSAVRGIVRAATDIGLQNLTLYAFSSENWKRPPTEVNHLMGLFRSYFRSDVDELIARNVRLRIIGNRSRAETDILEMIEDCERRTAANAGLNLTFAFDYGSQEEIAAAARALAEAARDGTLDPASITPQSFSAKLSTADLPDPDLIIRTSGERRLSNFLLWQSAYAELLFVDTLWPDFSPKQFLDALESYAQRERRFGAVSPEAVA